MNQHIHRSRVETLLIEQERRSIPATEPPRHWLIDLLHQRSVQLILATWVVANILIQVIARGSLPFDRPSMAGMSFGQQILIANALIVEIVVLMVIAYALTRQRAVPVMDARAPAPALARRETALLIGSATTTVILGGLTYALLHLFDDLMVFKTPGDAALSLIFLLLLYGAPGMFKSLLTLRTGNAWVHVWAYHALVPHTIGNTGLIVKIFGIRPLWNDPYPWD